MTNYRFIKFGTGKPATCKWCLTKTNYILVYPDGSECWCCPVHAYKIGKIKRLRAFLRKYTKKQKSLKFSENPRVKNEQMTILSGGMR